MSLRVRGFIAAVACVMLLAAPAQKARAVPHVRVGAPCGAPMPAGPLVDPPQIEVGTLPLDDRGQHGVILRVAGDHGRFCFKYALNGAEQHVAPILRVHRGERFALRVVNELRGPATGASIPASALARCMPSPMPAMMTKHYVGYLNHTVYARRMQMRDVDVNLHLHGFEGRQARKTSSSRRSARRCTRANTTLRFHKRNRPERTSTIPTRTAWRGTKLPVDWPACGSSNPTRRKLRRPTSIRLFCNIAYRS